MIVTRGCAIPPILAISIPAAARPSSRTGWLTVDAALNQAPNYSVPAVG